MDKYYVIELEFLRNMIKSVEEDDIVTKVQLFVTLEDLIGFRDILNNHISILDKSKETC